MVKRLTLGFAFALVTAPALMAAPSLPAEATARLPWSQMAQAAANALCSYLSLC